MTSGKGIINKIKSENKGLYDMNQHTTQAEGILSLAKEVLKIESAAVSALSDRIGDDFVRAVPARRGCPGRGVGPGFGESGAYGRKNWGIPQSPLPEHPLSLFMPLKHRTATWA